MTSEASFEFFRKLPAAPVPDGLLASLQAFETSLFLIALERFPHALTSCTFAVEAALKASPLCKRASKGLLEVIAAARKASPAIEAFPQEDLDHLRQKRNDIVHKGYSPKDDNISGDLLLNVGMPFLSCCYREFHAFDILESLLPAIAEQTRIAGVVYGRRRSALLQQPRKNEQDVTYCFRALAHLIGWSCKDSFSPSWELRALQQAEEIGAKFDRIADACDKLERLFRYAWRFDCPICSEHKGAVADLDEDALVNETLRPTSLTCPSCALVVRSEHEFLAEELLAPCLAQEEVAILMDYGIRRPT
jgi:hypothetical protein